MELKLSVAHMWKNEHAAYWGLRGAILGAARYTFYDSTRISFYDHFNGTFRHLKLLKGISSLSNSFFFAVRGKI